MHIIILNYHSIPVPPQELIRRFHITQGWASGLAQHGARVTIFQRFHQDHILPAEGVSYHFIKDSYGQSLSGWQIPFRFHRAVAQTCRASLKAGEPCVVHLHGLIFPIQAYHLRKVLPRQAALVVQHHAETPWRGWRSTLQRLGLSVPDGFLFSPREVADPWLERRIISDPDKIYTIFEGSTGFRLTDQATARRATGLDGNPLLLWVGRLNANKDPATVLAGFELALQSRPEARLYMIYSTDELLEWVKGRIASSPELRHAVVLLGRCEHHELENYINSANFFVLGSHSETTGIALMEALACGVTPIVTGIPSFRQITGDGKVGFLWEPGDVEGCTQAILTATAGRTDRHAVRDWFEAKLSYPALGRTALEIYAQVLRRRAEVTGR